MRPESVTSPRHAAERASAASSASSCCASSAALASSGTRTDFLLTLDLGNEPIEDEERKERLLETARWSQEQLGAEGLEFLRGFQPTVVVEQKSAAMRRRSRTRT